MQQLRCVAQSWRIEGLVTALSATLLVVDGSLVIGQPLAFGRSRDNDVILPDLVVSRHHTRVSLEADGVHLIDLDSTIGTFVNGHRVSEAVLQVGDQWTVGTHTFVVTEAGFASVENARVGLLADSLGVVTKDGVELLRDVNLDIPTGSLVAVVGPSGSGKTTMVNAITGLRPASSGSVNVYGHDLYAEYGSLRRQIGVVPQEDLVHPQLPVRDALLYAGRLRFSPDVTGTEIEERVDAVMSQLGLTERADLRVDRLSGGQRKRVSVALELLTQPTLLFLDEPTSGLDPGLDRTVMELLRGLADDERIVFVVTHSMANLDLCDLMVVLAEGGTCAYFGPPADAPAHFGVEDYASVFQQLSRAKDPQTTNRGRTRRLVMESRQMTAESARPAWRQFATLTRRYGHVILADRTYLAIIVFLPFLLGALGFVVGSSDGFVGGSTGYKPGTPANPGASVLLLILVLGTTFMGIASSIQEVVKERVILQRERGVGLPLSSYLGSKMVLLSAISLAQTSVFVLCTLIGRSLADEALGLSKVTDLLVPCLVLGVVSVALGLAISTFISSTEQALPLLVLATMVLLVLSGALTLRFEGLLEAAQYVVPSFWTHNALAAAVDLNTLSGRATAYSLWEHSLTVWRTGVLVTAVFTPVFLALALVGLRRRS